VSEQRYRDVFGDEVVLADTVRATILAKHPETADFIDQINHILVEPDGAQRAG
jgi:hypothetical protein